MGANFLNLTHAGFLRLEFYAENFSYVKMNRSGSGFGFFIMLYWKHDRNRVIFQWIWIRGLSTSVVLATCRNWTGSLLQDIWMLLLFST
jgi:hypothetical protein